VAVRSPAELSLELNIPAKRIREALRDAYGTLPDGVQRWELSEEQADYIRRQFPRILNPDPVAWSLEVGDVVSRRSIHAAYGGSRQSGIVTSSTIPDIMIFTDTKGGSEFGYDVYEGLQPDGSFAYTGQGQRGDQTFQRGNLALRDSGATDRPIRLLSVDGGRVIYVGRFATGDPTCRIETIADANNNPRSGIIFNLVPVDADTSYLEDQALSTATAPLVAIWTPPDSSDVAVIRDDHEYVGDRVVSRVEFKLQSDFGLWARSRGAEPTRLLLRSDGTTIEPDLYIESWGWVVEAKKSTGREYVRTALGQVLDYAHVARNERLNVSPVILLPGRPSNDLLALIRSHDVIVVVQRDGDFDVLHP
jgi:hypothetical protein